ncbi:MAG: PAS domain S-box protein [Candidatus Lambdaproteobacteria bacterium]|nr:PAS domain S-box protein [Candidatus Lambdaproteobacteria bacterium]
MSLQLIENGQSRRLGWAVLLTIMAFLIVGGLGLVGTVMEGFLPDSGLVNIAGRQRMLAQVIAKDSFLRAHEQDPERRAALRSILRDNQAQWLRVHRGLRHGDPALGLTGRSSARAGGMLDDLEPLVAEVNALLARLDQDSVTAPEDVPLSQPILVQLLDVTEAYLVIMDQLVTQYAADLDESLWRRHVMIGLILAVAIMLIIQAGIIIRRLMDEVRHTHVQLVATNSALQREVELHTNAEAAMRRLYVAVEHADEGIIVTDARGNILYVNPAFTRITGYERESMLGQRPRILSSGKQDSRFYRQMWETLLQGNVWRGRLVNRHSKGPLYTTEQVISPVIDPDGKITNFIGITIDITSRIALEERVKQAQKMEIFGALAGGVAHDFNNLLTPILGFAELALLKEIGDAELRDDLERIRKAALSARALTQQILNFSRRGTGRSTTLEAEYVVREAVELMRVALPSNISIETAVARNLPPIAGDAAQVQTVLMNLCINATRAMPKGGTVTIVASEVSFQGPDEMTEARRMVRIDVQDTGVGMEPHVLRRIFEPYFTTNADAGGSGMGLANVRQIVNAHRGHIEVQSTPGIGSAFSIYLPVVEALSVAERAKIPMPWGNGTAVLLAGRQQSIMQCCKQHLEFFGYRVTFVEGSATVAQQIVQSDAAYRLLLTDNELADATGWQLAEQVHALLPGLPIILMTGSPAIEPSDTASVTHVLRKPFTLDELAEAIASVQR